MADHLDADFTITNCGSIALVTPLHREAAVWLEEHTDGLWHGGGLAVEPRYLGDLIEGIEGEGFTVH